MKLTLPAALAALTIAASPALAVGYVHTYKSGALSCATGAGYQCPFGPTMPGFSGFTVETHGKTYKQARKRGSYSMSYYQDEMRVTRVTRAGVTKSRVLDCTVKDCTAAKPRWLGGDAGNLFNVVKESGFDRHASLFIGFNGKGRIKEFTADRGANGCGDLTDLLITSNAGFCFGKDAFSYDGVVLYTGEYGGWSRKKIKPLTAVDAPMVAPVPLPAAAWMLLAGIGALGVVGSRRRSV